MKPRGPADVGGPERVHRIEPEPVKPVSEASPTCAGPQAEGAETADVARFLEELARLPDVRQEKVDAVRQQIADGTYETPDKLDKAIEDMLGELW